MTFDPENPITIIWEDCTDWYEGWNPNPVQHGNITTVLASEYDKLYVLYKALKKEET